MKTVTISAARKRFGALLDAVQQEPVLVCRRNGDKVVIISAERYKQMYGITSFEPEPIKPARKKKTL
jgi:prevent-host-death family protein